MFKKTLVMAAPVLASAALVAGGLTASTVQANAADGHGSKAPVTEASAKRATATTTCDGTLQKRTWNRGVSGWVYAGSDTGSTVVPGSFIRVKGPRTGKDVLSVNLSAASYLDSGSEGRVKVLVDGVPMRPSDVSTGSIFSAAGYGTFAQNYCRNIGRGYHNLRVVISDNDYGASGSYYFELLDPMVHVEKSE